MVLDWHAYVSVVLVYRGRDQELMDATGKTMSKNCTPLSSFCKFGRLMTGLRLMSRLPSQSRADDPFVR
jgi:hypothetical protein